MSAAAIRARASVSPSTPSSTSASRPLLADGARGPEVAALQKKLAQLGFDPGPADGQFGPKTEAAVVAFQRANHLAVDGIVGPETWGALDGGRPAPPPPGDGFDPSPPPRGPTAPTPPSRGGAATPAVPSATPETVNAGARAPLSNGVPQYKQGDAAWGGIRLNDDDTISSAGCAITAAAMAVSKVSGARIDPSQVDAQLDRTGGYASGSDSIGDWNKIGGVVSPPVSLSRKDGLTPSALNAQLDAGKPVVIGVNYSGGTSNAHWMTVTGRGSDAKGPYYEVNDPATGGTLKMRPDATGALAADPSTTSRAYRTTGAFVTVG